MTKKNNEHREIDDLKSICKLVNEGEDSKGESSMQSQSKQHCVVCDNKYDKIFEIIKDGNSYFFDCFECAIHKLAPQCIHCGCKIIGHGMEANNNFYCCAHCAKKKGESTLKDRA